MELVRSDPGLLFAFLSIDAPLPTSSTPGRISAAGLLHLSDRLLVGTAPWVDWERTPGLTAVVRTAVAAGRFAELLCDYLHIDDVPRAWAGTWLALAGWLAVGITDPAAVTDVIAKQTPTGDPREAQRRIRGLTRAEIAWRLSGSWTVPAWAVPLLGRIDAPPADAERYGAPETAAARAGRDPLAARPNVASTCRTNSTWRRRSSNSDPRRPRSGSGSYARTSAVSDWLDRDWTTPDATRPARPARPGRGRPDQVEAAAEPATVGRVSDSGFTPRMAAVAELPPGPATRSTTRSPYPGHSQYC